MLARLGLWLCFVFILAIQRVNAGGAPSKPIEESFDVRLGRVDFSTISTQEATEWLHEAKNGHYQWHLRRFTDVIMKLSTSNHTLSDLYAEHFRTIRVYTWDPRSHYCVYGHYIVYFLRRVLKTAIEEENNVVISMILAAEFENTPLIEQEFMDQLLDEAFNRRDLVTIDRLTHPHAEDKAIADSRLVLERRLIDAVEMGNTMVMLELFKQNLIPLDNITALNAFRAALDSNQRDSLYALLRWTVEHRPRLFESNSTLLDDCLTASVLGNDISSVDLILRLPDANKLDLLGAFSIAKTTEMAQRFLNPEHADRNQLTQSLIDSLIPAFIKEQKLLQVRQLINWNNKLHVSPIALSEMRMRYPPIRKWFYTDFDNITRQ